MNWTRASHWNRAPASYSNGLPLIIPLIQYSETVFISISEPTCNYRGYVFESIHVKREIKKKINTTLQSCISSLWIIPVSNGIQNGMEIILMISPDYNLLVQWKFLINKKVVFGSKVNCWEVVNLDRFRMIEDSIWPWMDEKPACKSNASTLKYTFSNV